MNARAGFRSSFIPFIVGNALVLFLLIADFNNSAGGVIQQQAYWGRDFINVWTAGKLVLAGRLDLLYDPVLYQGFQQQLFGPLGPHNYSYPPFTLPLMAPFALLPYWLALMVWLTGTGWLFVRAAAPWWREATGWPAMLVLLTPAATMNIWAGQYGFLIGAILLFGWRALEKGRPWLAGFCFGLMAIKPHLALFVPLILLLRGEGRAIIAGVLTVTGMVLVSMLLFGVAPWRDFLTITTGAQGAMVNAGAAFFGKMSTSTATALFAIGAPKAVALTGQAAIASLAVAMVVHVARRGQVRDIALLAATATFLTLPYAFNYDLTVSAMGATMAMGLVTLSRMERGLATLGFLAAQLGMVLAMLHLPLMPLLLGGLAIVQYRIARKNSAPVPPSQQAQA
ncbi:MAG: glycosyltransferase family 87 protein [Sphingomonadaceae bacterium]